LYACIEIGDGTARTDGMFILNAHSGGPIHQQLIKRVRRMVAGRPRADSRAGTGAVDQPEIYA
jgi:hypothetical protein